MLTLLLISFPSIRSKPCSIPFQGSRRCSKSQPLFMALVHRGGALNHNTDGSSSLSSFTSSSSSEDIIATFTQELEKMRRELEQEAEMEMSMVKLDLQKKMKKNHNQKKKDKVKSVDILPGKKKEDYGGLEESILHEIDDESYNDDHQLDDKKQEEEIDLNISENSDKVNEDDHVLYDVEYEYEEVFVTDNESELQIFSDNDVKLDPQEQEEDLDHVERVFIDNDAEIEKDTPLHQNAVEYEYTEEQLDAFMIHDEDHKYEMNEMTNELDTVQYLEDENDSKIQTNQQAKVELSQQIDDTSKRKNRKANNKKSKSHDKKKKKQKATKNRTKLDSTDGATMSIQRSDETKTTSIMVLFVKSLVPILIISLLMFLSHLFTQFLITKI